MHPGPSFLWIVRIPSTWCRHIFSFRGTVAQYNTYCISAPVSYSLCSWSSCNWHQTIILYEWWHGPIAPHPPSSTITCPMMATWSRSPRLYRSSNDVRQCYSLPYILLRQKAQKCNIEQYAKWNLVPLFHDANSRMAWPWPACCLAAFIISWSRVRPRASILILWNSYFAFSLSTVNQTSNFMKASVTPAIT
jgi:hypothetical protein